MTRQSAYASYLECNRSFKISQEVEIKPSQAMINGIIFESFLLGFKNEEDKELCYTKAGKINSSSVRLETLANKLKKYFGDGACHERISYNASGEPDFVGMFAPDLKDFKECIVDIKLTKDINKIWEWKNNKSELLQSVSYPYLVFTKLGKQLPFYYFVVEDNDYDVPIVRIIEVKTTPEDWKWFRKLVETADNDIFLEPNAEKCLGKSTFEPRCRYLEYCEFGRNLVGGARTLNFNTLQSSFTIEEEKKEDWKEIKNVKKKEYNPDFDIAGDLVETDIDNIEQDKNTYITVTENDFRDKGFYCRNCRTVQIQEKDKICSNCKSKIIWVGQQ